MPQILTSLANIVVFIFVITLVFEKGIYNDEVTTKEKLRAKTIQMILLYIDVILDVIFIMFAVVVFVFIILSKELSLLFFPIIFIVIILTIFFVLIRIIIPTTLEERRYLIKQEIKEVFRQCDNDNMVIITDYVVINKEETYDVNQI